MLRNAYFRHSIYTAWTTNTSFRRSEIWSGYLNEFWE